MSKKTIKFYDKDAADHKFGQGGGGFVVKFTKNAQDEVTCDKTFDEICAKIDAGNFVIGYVKGADGMTYAMMPTIKAGTSGVVFSATFYNDQNKGIVYQVECYQSEGHDFFEWSVVELAGGEPEDQTDYLCFTSQQDGSTLSMMTQLTTPPDLKYSTDKVNWTQWQFTEGEEGSMADVITLDEGEKVYFKGLNPNGFVNAEENLTSAFVMTGLIAASGDVGTITDEIGGADCTLVVGCYAGMFGGCSSLTAAPALPATTLANLCYNSMFAGCTSLTSAPELPATTLVVGCYSGMFAACSSLTAAPALPATTLAQTCYAGMFSGCTSLNSVTVGATSWDAESATYWLEGVSATGTFTKPSATEIPEGISGIPSGWTVVNV